MVQNNYYSTKKIFRKDLVYPYMADLLRELSVPSHVPVTYPEIFRGERFLQGVWEGAFLMGPGQSSGGDQTAKLPEAPRIYYSEITYIFLKYTLHNMWWN